MVTEVNLIHAKKMLADAHKHGNSFKIKISIIIEGHKAFGSICMNQKKKKKKKQKKEKINR